MGKLSRLRLLSKSKKVRMPNGVNSEEIEVLCQSIDNKNIMSNRKEIKRLTKEPCPNQKIDQTK